MKGGFMDRFLLRPDVAFGVFLKGVFARRIVVNL